MEDTNFHKQENPAEAPLNEDFLDRATIPLPELPLQEEASPDAELDLESIIEEFRDTIEFSVEDVLAAEALTAAPEQEAVPVSGDTVRMDFSAIRSSAYQGAAPIPEDEPTQVIPIIDIAATQTIPVLEDMATQAIPVVDDMPTQPLPVLEDLRNPSTPLAEDVPTQPIPVIGKEATEPFSEQWEPEYEQPMGEYVPPQPILIHPQSRLRELKKKLVNGPERRYYQLAELGTGKLQVLIFITFLVMLLCAGSTVLYFLNMVAASRMKLLIFGQLLAMFLCALIGSFQLIEGLADLLRGRFSLNTLLIFSFILCCADGFLCLMSQTRVPCCAAFTLQVFLSLYDTVYRRRIETSQMDTLRKATNLTAVRVATQKVEGKKVLLRDEGQVEDFMDNYWRRSLPEKIRSWYAVGALIASLGVGITGWALQDLATGLQVAAICLLAAVPASFFICLSRPADILEKRFRKLGTVLCGWKGIRNAKGAVMFPLTHADLFPNGTVKMNGVKFYGNRDPDEVVAYGSALILCDSNGLAPLFEQLLESRNCHHLSAQNVERYQGGISGEVRGESVLVGTLSFLREMEVELPEGLKVSNAVCVAIDGALCGLFAISYERTRPAIYGLHTLCSYRRVKPVVCDGDFLICPGFLRAKFGVSPKRILVADSELRDTIVTLEPDRENGAVLISTRQDLPSAAFGVTGARALRSASYLGLAVHMIGGILGIGIMLTLVILGATSLLTPLNVILYQLIWSIPGILLTEWTRLI